MLAFSKGQNFSPYQFYDQEGKRVSPKSMLDDLAGYDVVLFGEFHNNSINHWLQLKVTEGLFVKKKEALILGAEMFERDNQNQINQYLKGALTEPILKDSVRLWNNFATDYKGLLSFAKTHHLKFIASNVPRIYASQVSKKGLNSLNSLSDKEKLTIAKLPIQVSYDTPGYKEMKSLMGEHVEPSQLFNFVSAQALKDATMAESILNALQPNALFLHYNGDYHSRNYGGIYWYLKKSKPALRIAVISVVENEDDTIELPKEALPLTNYTLVIPSDMIKTY